MRCSSSTRECSEPHARCGDRSALHWVELAKGATLRNRVFEWVRIRFLAILCVVFLGCGDSTEPSDPQTLAAVLSTAVVSVDNNDAEVSAVIDPTPSGSRYACRYGRTPSTDSLAVEGVLDGNDSPVTTSASLLQLRPSTRYYFRWEVDGPAGQPEGRLDSLVTLPPNQRPETGLTVASVDTVDAMLRFDAAWAGFDSDGSVVAFDVMPSYGGEESPWIRTSRSDSTFVVDPASPELYYRLSVRAVDDDGAVDSQPASVVFQLGFSTLRP